MITQSQQPISYGTAKRLRHNAESISDAILVFRNNVVVTTVLCDECGERFAVFHHPASRDISLAERQAVWLKDRFVWDHIQETKHSGSIRLPGLHEMQPVPQGR